MNEKQKLFDTGNLLMSASFGGLGQYANVIGRFMTGGLIPGRGEKEKNGKEEIKFFMKQFFDFLDIRQDEIKQMGKFNAGSNDIFDLLIAQKRANAIRLMSGKNRETTIDDRTVQSASVHYSTDAGIDIDTDWNSRHKALTVRVINKSDGILSGISFLFTPKQITSMDQLIDTECIPLIFNVNENDLIVNQLGQIIFLPDNSPSNYEVYHPVTDFSYRQLNNRRRHQFMYVSSYG